MQCTAAWQPTEFREATFTRFIIDNVDHNLKTLTGCDTFHGMGIVAVSTSIAPDVQFDSSSVVSFDQEAFLSNTSNKQHFINMLAQHLRDCNFHIRQSEGDADIDVAAAAIHLTEHGNPVEVYAEDTDILALLLYHWQPSKAPVFFKSDGKAKSPGKCVDVGTLQNRIGLANRFSFCMHLVVVTHCMQFLCMARVNCLPNSVNVRRSLNMCVSCNIPTSTRSRFAMQVSQ
jgi:hypothetical protein